jgi:hypothetical protein
MKTAHKNSILMWCNVQNETGFNFKRKSSAKWTVTTVEESQVRIPLISAQENQKLSYSTFQSSLLKIHKIIPTFFGFKRYKYQL